jgi:hypothetical protein
MVKFACPLWAIFLPAVVLTACCDLPTYNPGFWNDGITYPTSACTTVQCKNNCYNYGNNKKTMTFAQPGRASGITLAWPSDMNCTAVTSAAVSDGVLELPASGVCPDKQDKIAMVVAPSYDYHWYRQDSGGMWTHKPGKTEATNLDNASNPITNPETASRGPYTQFCGYFCSCSDDQEGKGHETIN